MNSMGNSWYYRGSMKSCMMGNWGVYCSCMMNSMGNYWGSMDSMMNTMGNTWDNWSSMKRSMVGNWMDGVVGNWVDSMVDRFRDWLAIFIKFGFGKEWIEKGIGIEGVQFWGSITVNSIPCFTSEKMLVKQCSIWTDKSSTMRTMSSVFTNTVGLTSRVYISVHARLEGGLSTQELGVRSLVKARIVNTSMSRDSMLVVMFLVVGFRMVGGWLRAIGGGWGMVGCWGRSIGWGRWMVGC